MSAVPSWLQGEDRVEEAELRSLIGDVGALDLNKPMGDAELDVLASRICRALGEIEKNLERYDAALDLEIENLRARYARFTAPLVAYRNEIEAAGIEIAKRAEFPGKSKSRNVGYGCYGSRKTPERITVADPEKAIASLEAMGKSEALRLKKAVDVKTATPIVLDWLKSTGEVIDGFEHQPAAETFYIKPE